MVKLLLGWVLVMGLIVLAIRLIWPAETGRASADATRASVKGTSGDESVVKLNQALAPCSEVLSAFLEAGTPEARNQFVLNPVATAGPMARFYALNPLSRIDPKTVRNTANSLLDLPTGQALESRWVSTDGRTLDCVFVQQKGEWRLDWEHFARYGDYPWSLFLAGDGKPEAEFRLLVRERLAQERSESSHMSLVFYAPRFGYPELIGSASPEFLLSRDSDDGQLLTAAFIKRQAGEPLYGSTLPYLEPDGMIRVRVKVRRLNPASETGQKFELVQIIACHWLALDDPGVKPPSPAPQADPESPPPPAN
jgi:hypothetical protein